MKKLEMWLFNGYVREPIPIVVLVLLVGFAFLALTLYGTFDYMDSTPVTAAEACCVITAYEKDGPVYVCESDIAVTFSIPSRAIQDPSVLEMLRNTQQAVLVKYELPTKKAYRDVEVLSISDINGSNIISEAALTQAWEQNNLRAFVILWGACLLYWGLSGGCYYILCHAPDHPRLAAILIQKEFRNF